MNLIKWFRKNQSKIMAVVVVILLVGFIGGAALQAFLEQIGQGRKRVIAYYGQNRKITNQSLERALMELEILKMLQAHQLLRQLPVLTLEYQPARNLNALLLGELLFPDTNISVGSVAYMRQIRTPQGYTISDEQIDNIYKYGASNSLIWFLLKNEAHQAGVNIPPDAARENLVKLIPKIFGGATYAQVINSFINPPPGSRRTGIAEKTILQAFGNLLDILEYAHLICSSENLTEQQIKHNISLARQTVDTEIVKFAAELFSENVPEPNDSQIAEHFEKYKEFLPGYSTEMNPYGFGYKQPDRVQLQYIAVKIDDIEKTIEKTTQEEALEFYQKNRESFTRNVPEDPNDPNSPLIARTLSYPEVAQIVMQKIKTDKLNNKANSILQRAKSLTEAEFEIDISSQKITEEQFEKIADNYKNIADRLSEEYEIKLFTGQTGLLGIEDIQKDEYIAGLFLEGYGYDPMYNQNRVWLHRIVFAIDEIGTSYLSFVDVRKPNIYENIGPMKDIFGKVRALVRIIKAQKAAVPENINLTFNTETLDLDGSENQNKENIYSLREKIIEDLKKISAMQIAKEKADKFINLATETDWENAINEFNRLYPGSPDEQMADPNNFRIRKLTAMPRMSNMEQEIFNINTQGYPSIQLSIRDMKNQQLLIDTLYSLVPSDANSLRTVPYLLEFKPHMSCYCIKNLALKRLDQAEYNNIKAEWVYNEDIARTQSMAVIHFNPENILVRSNYSKPVSREELPQDANQPPQTKG